jgi:hypothetical protein
MYITEAESYASDETILFAGILHYAICDSPLLKWRMFALLERA